MFKKPLPDKINILYSEGFLVGVIQFGSSVFKEHPGDIDLALVLKPEKLNEFITRVNQLGHLDDVYDISLILSEETSNKNNFNFGGHGSYLIESFRKGKTLIGKNPFLGFPLVPIEKIKNDIVERMREYMYIVRKSYFTDKVAQKLESRYEKSLKLFYYLLVGKDNFPEVLMLPLDECLQVLKEKSFLSDNRSQDKREIMESLWKETMKQYS